MKTCSQCKQTKPLTAFYRDSTKPDGRRRQCGQCMTENRSRPEMAERHRQRARDYRKNRGRTAVLRAKELAQKRRWLQANPEAKRRDNVKGRVYRAVRRGALERPNQCTDCGIVTKVQAHHEDYDRPFDVTWLCKECHGQRHRRIA